MDPLSLIVTAVATGAALGLKPTAEQAVKDAYAGLKRLIVDRYGGRGDVAEAVEKVEAKQEADWPREMLREELDATGAAEDRELIQAAQARMKAARPDRDVSVSVTASDHSVAVGGSVGGSVTSIHGDGNVVGDGSE
ncbi:MAG: hypothetical protein GF355_03485, partial [Candidatus Eisenbacteria bacterium]|nr:hypothetical protein [Candidatus Eisenbacteria bacterium]